MSDVEPPAKLCLNPDCTRKNPVKGNWCTAKQCKNVRALGMAAKKQDTLHKACAAVGVPVPAALPADGGQCFELHSVHGVLDCDFPHLGGKALEKAPPDDPKEMCFLVYGTFAATEDDFENSLGNAVGTRRISMDHEAQLRRRLDVGHRFTVVRSVWEGVMTRPLQ